VARYWIDLKRNGHVVRQVIYRSDRIGSRLDIKLAPFKIGGEEVWMPVSGESLAYTARVGGKSMSFREPTSIGLIYVVDGTMEFNRNPGPETFTINYKPGTPISDHLRQMTTEFGRK